MRLASIVLTLCLPGCVVSSPQDQQAEQKAFYAKQNEIRAQHQADRQRASVESAKEKNERLEAQDAKRTEDRQVRQAAQNAADAEKHETEERNYEEKRVQAQVTQRERYAAKKAAQEQAQAADEAAVDAEIAQCRADSRCVWKRVSEPLCEALKNKRLYQQDMAKERANPSGVVNIKYLHELGVEIQSCDENIAMFRKDYREQMHRALDEAKCPR